MKINKLGMNIAGTIKKVCIINQNDLEYGDNDELMRLGVNITWNRGL